MLNFLKVNLGQGIKPLLSILKVILIWIFFVLPALPHSFQVILIGSNRSNIQMADIDHAVCPSTSAPLCHKIKGEVKRRYYGR
jgi:hypothetical protein